MLHHLTLFVVLLLTPIDSQENADYVDGDILTHLDRRVVIPDPESRWPMIIPYFIDASLDNYVDVITSAVDEYRRATCLDFERLDDTSADPWPVDYLYFNSSSGCGSFVGRQGGRQLVSIEAETCTFKGIVLHELFHALGFLHEHNRPDRDDHIDILWANVDPVMVDHLQLYSDVHVFGEEYDYHSISHGSNYLYSVDRFKVTIMSKSDPGMLLGQRERLSDLDLVQIHAYYPCPTTTETTSEDWSSEPTTRSSMPTTLVGNRACDGTSESTVAPHPLDCNKFYLCQGWTAVEMKCPAGLYFNTHTSACDWPSAVTDCPRTTVPYV